MRVKLLSLAFLILAPVAGLAIEGADTGSGRCDFAARASASKWGIPEQIMLAITRVETGRSRGVEIAAWPWTINLAGKGYWFDSFEQALAFATSTKAGGSTNFDIGCFQINMGWHGGAFGSLEDALTPEQNADYAAQFLARLYQETGSWRAAAAAYHSKTPEYAEAYLAKLEPVLRELLAAAPEIPQQVDFAPERENRFPLLQRGRVPGNASLVPMVQMNGPLIRGTP